MAGIFQAMKWLREGKKICRPSWNGISYWCLGCDEEIEWANKLRARVHLKQIEADDWEIFEEGDKGLSRKIINTNVAGGMVPVEEIRKTAEKLKERIKTVSIRHNNICLLERPRNGFISMWKEINDAINEEFGKELI